MTRSRRLHLDGNDCDHQLVRDQMRMKSMVGFGSGAYNSDAIIDPACIVCTGEKEKPYNKCKTCPEYRG